MAKGSIAVYFTIIYTVDGYEKSRSHFVRLLHYHPGARLSPGSTHLRLHTAVVEVLWGLFAFDQQEILRARTECKVRSAERWAEAADRPNRTVKNVRRSPLLPWLPLPLAPLRCPTTIVPDFVCFRSLSRGATELVSQFNNGK